MFFLVALCLLLTIQVLAHSGRTDSDGGHWDRSTGEYHYHHGYSPHDHYDIDGDGEIDCPIFYERTSAQTTESKSSNWDDTIIWIIISCIIFVLVLSLFWNADTNTATGCGCFATYLVVSILISLFELHSLYVLAVVALIAIAWFVSYGLYKFFKKKN